MRLHLIDGTYELFRAHFSRRPERLAPDGRDVKATVGVVSSLLALLADPEEAVTHLAVAFDNPIVSFRNDMFEGYKSDFGVPEELRNQFDDVERAVAALGVVVWSMDRWEADDALATGAARFAPQVEQVRIMTPDKDLGQCLEGTKVVQVDRMREKVIDVEAFVERRGIQPHSMPDWLGLVGDTADGIPGIPGFGEKSASTVLARYDHLEAIPADAADWDVKVRGAAKLAQTLASRIEDARLYRDLATLVRDVPLEQSLDELRYRGAPGDAWHAWCDELGVGDLRTRATLSQ